MGWPKGVKRGPRQKKEVVPDSDERAATNSEQPASQPVTEVRASPHRESAGRAGYSSMKAAPKRPQWKMQAGNLWEIESGMADEASDILHIPRDVFPDGLEFMWGTRSVRGQETPQIRNGYRKSGWLEVHDGDFEGSPFWEFARHRWARDEGGYIVYEACVLLANREEVVAEMVRRDKVRARQQLAIKEQALTGGGINATGADDPSALGFNKIKRTVERIEIPKD